MDRLRRTVNKIAYTPDLSKLPPLHRSLLPFLSLASTAYSFALSVRHHLYLSGFLRKRRLPVPVISVGNLTWGGNGKTPMVEFLSLWFSQASISPLVLSRGYAGGDEVRMLQRHFNGTSAKIGVGANRAMTASSYLNTYGYVDSQTLSISCSRLTSNEKVRDVFDSAKIGVVILDDGMQHISLLRSVEIVMVNGLMPWGNHQLLPLGPLREPLTSLQRADVIVVHHADLVSEQDLKQIELKIERITQSVPVYFTTMAPSHFFMARNIHYKMPLSTAANEVILCLSAIGSPDAFHESIRKLGPLYIDQIDFSDHHYFQADDIVKIKMKMKKLQERFSVNPLIVVTEKDYDRDCDALLHFHPYNVLVLCSQLQFVPINGCSEQNFKKVVMQLLQCLGVEGLRLGELQNPDDPSTAEARARAVELDLHGALGKEGIITKESSTLFLA